MPTLREFKANTTARNYRALAAECERQAELAVEEPLFRALQERLAKSYAALADAEDWLDGVEPPASLAHAVGEDSRRAA
jgi:hypothetical protein